MVLQVSKVVLGGREVVLTACLTWMNRNGVRYFISGSGLEWINNKTRVNLVVAR